MKKPFEIGQRVKVYTVDCDDKETTHIDTITEIEGNILTIENLPYTVHARQCTRLVKKKKEVYRVWFNKRQVDMFTSNDRNIGYCIKTGPEEIECELKIIGKRK